MNSRVRDILFAVGIIAALIILWYIRAVISYVLIAAIVSIIGRPIMHFFERQRIGGKPFHPGISAILTLLIMLTVLTGFVGLFIPLVQEEAQVISSINSDQVEASLQGPMTDFGNWLDNVGFVPEGESKEDFVKSKTNALFDYIRVSDIFSYFMARMGNVLIGLMSVLFISFFFLKDRSMIFRTIYSLTPEGSKSRMHDVLRNTKHILTRYFVGICIQISLITIIVTVGLSVLGVKHAFLIGFLAGLVNVIPYLGPAIGAFFGILIAITGNLELDFYSETVPLIMKVISVFALVQALDNFVFQPYIFSNSVNAHPLEIFLVILVASTLAGITGMILAVPTYSFLRIVAKEFYSQFTLVQTMTKGMDEEKKSSRTVNEIKKKLFK